MIKKNGKHSKGLKPSRVIDTPDIGELRCFWLSDVVTTITQIGWSEIHSRSKHFQSLSIPKVTFHLYDSVLISK